MSRCTPKIELPTTLPEVFETLKPFDGYQAVINYFELGVRAAWALLQEPCMVCRHGCHCEPGSPGCGHSGCWGAATRGAPEGLANSCPGHAAEEARIDGLRAAEKARVALLVAEQDARNATHSGLAHWNGAR